MGDLNWHNFAKNLKVINQNINILNRDVALFIKRDDLLHPTIPGNKFRKLKYNITDARKSGKQILLTFGGAYSNHIAATAAAGNEMGFKTIGIIRGEELKNSQLNATLQTAQRNGMELLFVPRDLYRNHNLDAFESFLNRSFSDCYILPEGGTNPAAIKGCAEILSAQDRDFDYVCCAVGTGGTIAGIINSSAENQKILGFPALLGGFLSDEIRKFATNPNWELITGYEFGGYAKVPAELVSFINTFRQTFEIPLDPIYTGKLVFGVMDMIEKDYFPSGSKILLIHTGGLQGIAGVNQRLHSKNLPLIDTHD